MFKIACLLAALAVLLVTIITFPIKFIGALSLIVALAMVTAGFLWAVCTDGPLPKSLLVVLTKFVTTVVPGIYLGCFGFRLLI